MAIKFQGARVHKTGAVQGPWSGVTNAGIHCRVMIDPAATPSQMNEPWVFGHDSSVCFGLVFSGAGSNAGTVKISPQVMDSAGTLHFVVVDNVPLGVVLTLGITHDGTAGAQKFYMNGVASTISSFAGTTKVNTPANLPWNVGGRGINTPGANAIWTLDDVTIWQGYTPTAADMAALRDGADPLSIPAPTRYRWTCAVPAGKVVGDAVAVGDAGVLESLGTAVLNLTAFSGTGTSVYAAPLVWTPAIEVREARVGASGKTAFFFTRTITTGADANPTSVATAPTITVNGVNRGQLTNMLASGIHKYAFGSMPAGVVVAPSDVVTFDAPVQWLTTGSGVAAAMVVQPAVNRAGRSNVGTESLTKTLGMGLNVEWYPTGHNALAPFLKNWARRLDGFSNVLTTDATRKPLTTSNTTEFATLYSFPANLAANGIDATGYPGPTGLFAIGWDDTNPSVPTTFEIRSGDSATTTVTLRSDLTNPGSGGVGQVRVYDVQRKVGSTVAQTDFSVYMTNANKAPRFANLIINGPGDFTPTAPVVLDNSDPYALSSWFLDRTAGAGSLRCVNNTLVDAAYSSQIEPEHPYALTDFTWGWQAPRVYLVATFTRADPYSVADTPYYYSPTAGSKFAATLTDPIDATTTTLNIQDAATAPVIIGLRLYIGSEIMRVTAISGTTVTVIRGAEDTTPAAHAAGAIQVGFRLACPTLNVPAGVGALVKFTTAAPHRFTTGHLITYSGTGWPEFTYTNGAHDFPWNYGSVAMVTGPNTFVGTLGPYTAPQGTLTGTVTLPSTCTSIVAILGGPQIPYAMAAKMAGYVGTPNMWIEIPHAATNDYIRKVARDVRDNSTPGAHVWWLGMSDEPWNYAVPAGFFGMISASQGRPFLGYYVVRTGEATDIFKTIFDEGGRNRSGEIRNYISSNPVIPGQAGGMLTYAASLTPPIRIDGVGEAPYIDGGYAGSATQAKFAALDADQCADLYVHSLWYRTDGISIPGYAAGFQTVINTYNASTGFDCKLIGYEGGLATVTGNRAKDRDLFYSPAWYWGEGDFYALCQSSGFKVLNLYASTHDWNNGTNMWGLIHHHFQPHGMGGGQVASDGLAHDNRDCLATTKAATTNQDAANVSVRQQAWLDWNSGFVVTPPVTPPIASLVLYIDVFAATGQPAGASPFTATCRLKGG